MAKPTTDLHVRVHVMGLSQDDIVQLDSNVELLDASSWGGVEVKRDWVYTDPSGHNHDYYTYLHSTRQPTLDVHCLDCDDTHEEDDGPRRCRWCDEEVEPEYMSVGAYAKQIPGRESYHLITIKPVLLGALVIYGERVLEVVEEMYRGEISQGSFRGALWSYNYILAPIGKRHHTNDANFPALMHFGRHERKQP